MATIFQWWGVPELLATIWLRYSRVGGSTNFIGYVVFGQPLSDRVEQKKLAQTILYKEQFGLVLVFNLGAVQKLRSQKKL